MMQPVSGQAHVQDRLTSALLATLAACTAGVLLLVLAFVAREAWPALRHGGMLAFLFDDAWYPIEGRFGMAPMVLATAATTLLALLMAVPLGLACAVCASAPAPSRAGAWLRAALGLMAGIPSVVFGLWGLTVIVPRLAQWQAPGVSLLAASVVLALMILPTVALSGAQALAAVPAPLLHGAAALGIGPAATLLGVALPAARAGIAAGVVLAAARALGETMAVLMVSGNVVQMPTHLFKPVRVLTANMALEMPYAIGLHRSALFVSGLLLAVLVLALTGLPGCAAGKLRRGY
jgi:phosphate transport system permease protein